MIVIRVSIILETKKFQFDWEPVGALDMPKAGLRFIGEFFGG